MIYCAIEAAMVQMIAKAQFANVSLLTISSATASARAAI
jgi:hypothetical protein